MAEGGGCCGIENMRTLCVPCHHKQTAELKGRMRQAKLQLAAAGSRDLRDCWLGGASAQGEASASGPSTLHNGDGAVELN